MRVMVRMIRVRQVLETERGRKLPVRDVHRIRQRI
jgi:hypothetical protein